MSQNDTARWIVCYDIRDADRGLAMVRFMKRRGLPLQYSVFLVYASAIGIRRLMSELEDVIDTSEDDVRAYRWSVHAECEQLGPSLLPEDVLIGAAPLPAASRRRVPAAASTV